LFSGTEQCPKPSKPVDLMPNSERCGVTMLVDGHKNPFWFDYVPPQQSAYKFLASAPDSQPSIASELNDFI